MTLLFRDKKKIKEYFYSLKEFILFVNRRKFIILSIMFIFVLAAAYYSLRTPVHYYAEIKFMTDGNKSQRNGASAISGLLGSIGLMGGGGVASSEILETSASKFMIRDCIFSNVETGDYLANEILKIYANKLNLDNDKMRFIDDNIEEFNESHRKLFLFLYGYITKEKEPLLELAADKKSGLYIIRANTINENLSFDLAMKYYEVIKQYFEGKLMDKKVSGRNLIKYKTDSIKARLDYIVLQQAKFKDYERGYVFSKDKIRHKKLDLEENILKSAYMESTKLLDRAEFSVQNSQPLFATIDKPYKPIRKIKESLMKNVIMGVFIGLLVGVFLALIMELIVVIQE